MEKAKIPLEVQATANYLNLNPSAITRDIIKHLDKEYPKVSHSYNVAQSRINMAQENELISKERRDSTLIYYSQSALERMEKTVELYRAGESLREISKKLPKIVNRTISKNMAREAVRKILKQAIKGDLMSKLEYHCISRAKCAQAI